MKLYALFKKQHLHLHHSKTAIMSVDLFICQYILLFSVFSTFFWLCLRKTEHKRYFMLLDVSPCGINDSCCNSLYANKTCLVREVFRKKYISDSTIQSSEIFALEFMLFIDLFHNQLFYFIEHS